MTRKLVASTWLLLFIFAIVAPVQADFVVGFTNGPGMTRFSDNGQLIRNFTVYEGGNFGESMSQPVLGPDGLIYAVANDLGHATLERFDPDTGLAVDRSQFGTRTPFSGTDKIPTYAAASAPSFGPNGDLFVTDSGFLNNGTPRILRVDGNTGELRGATEVQFPFDVLAKAPGPSLSLFDTEVFVSMPGGKIDRFVAIGSNFHRLLAPLETGLSGNLEMELGPDGLLYLLDMANRSVARYDLQTQSIVDTFIPTIPKVPGSNGSWDYVGSLCFLPDGDLLLMNGGGGANNVAHAEIRRYDGSTGQFEGVQFTIPSQTYAVANGFVYLPVPEPAALSLIASAAIFCLSQRRGRCPSR